MSAVSPAIWNLQIDSGKINHDLSKFIDVKVDELSTKKQYQSKQKDMIKRALTEKAGGTFLYVLFVVQDLAKTRLFSQVRQKLQEFDPGQEHADMLPPNEQDEKALTDSDYVSKDYDRSIETRSSKEEFLEAETEDTEYTHQYSAINGFQSRTDKQDLHDKQDLQGLYTAETLYSASETSSMPPSQDKGYIADLATDLFRAVKRFELHRESLKHISKMLPELLRAFALKVGYKARTAMHRDVSFFIHKNRRRIQVSFEDMFSLEDITHDDRSLDIDTVQTGEFAVGRYLEEPDFENYEFHNEHDDLKSVPDFPEPNENDDTLEDHDEPTLDARIYRDFIVRTPAYSWLVASLHREANLTRANPDIMEDIRRKILDALPSVHKVSRKAPSQEYKVRFKLDWDPLSFVKEQQYTESLDEALERAITLTGSADDAQALTTGEYLSQTWPATGTFVMRLVTDVVRNTIGRHAASKLPDGTEIDAQIEGSMFVVTVTGTADSLAEIGQQFAWLGTALRSSPFEVGIATCSPFVRISRLENFASLAQVSEPVPLTEISCAIDFKMNGPSMSVEGLPGQCWHNMFRNPVMVSGYPVLTKHEHGLGLEMPLNVIAELAGSQRANEFDGKVFIKGFSTMLIATKLTRDLLIWHYLYNSRGERISYFDHTLQDTDNISLLQLDTTRHVVGWCSDCMFYAGAADARYNIDGTGLPRPHAGCLLEKVSISGGKIITGGVTVAVAVKDIPLHLARNGYIPKLKWIATKYVVLWDEADKRGWLVNGTSALLHLVQASLAHYSTDDFSSSFLFSPGKMKDAADHKPNSAPKVLTDFNNKEIEICPGTTEKFLEEETKQEGVDIEKSKAWKRKRGYYLFEDLVEQHYNSFEQMMDHHVHLAGQNGVNLKVRVRKHLEGWDFAELATDHDPYPRVATLQALGYGWVDFVRSIGAITLFGRGFGDIIRPIEFDGMCPHWKTLPKQKYYLAASVFDLKNIMKKFGDRSANPLRLVHDLLWHCPEDPVTPCRCQRHSSQKTIRRGLRLHNDTVQVFYPRRSRLVTHVRGPDALEDGGAIVFGHNFVWGYRWRESGNEDLEEGEIPPSSPFLEHQIMNARTGTNSVLSDRAASPSSTSPSSKSRQSTVGAMVRTSLSASSAQSTPVESIVGIAQALTSVKPEPPYDTSRPNQQTVPHRNKGRTLRHEKRRLESRGS